MTPRRLEIPLIHSATWVVGNWCTLTTIVRGTKHALMNTQESIYIPSCNSYSGTLCHRLDSSPVLVWEVPKPSIAVRACRQNVVPRAKPVWECRASQIIVFWQWHEIGTWVKSNYCCDSEFPNQVLLPILPQRYRAIQRYIALEVVSGKARSAWEYTVSITVVQSLVAISPKRMQQGNKIKLQDMLDLT